MLLGFAENKCSLFLKAAEYSMPTIFYQTCLKGHVSVQVAGGAQAAQTWYVSLNEHINIHMDKLMPMSRRNSNELK